MQQSNAISPTNQYSPNEDDIGQLESNPFLPIRSIETAMDRLLLVSYSQPVSQSASQPAVYKNGTYIHTAMTVVDNVMYSCEHDERATSKSSMMSGKLARLLCQHRELVAWLNLESILRSLHIIPWIPFFPRIALYLEPLPSVVATIFNDFT